MIVKEPNQVLHKMSSKVDDFNEAKAIAQQLTSVTKEVDKPWLFWMGLAALLMSISSIIVATNAVLLNRAEKELIAV